MLALQFNSGIAPWTGIAQLRGAEAGLVVTYKMGRASGLATTGELLWHAGMPTFQMCPSGRGTGRQGVLSVIWTGSSCAQKEHPGDGMFLQAWDSALDPFPGSSPFRSITIDGHLFGFGPIGALKRA
jgi:hypothetical protein